MEDVRSAKRLNLGPHCERDGVVDIDAEVANCIFDVGVAE